MNGDRIFPAPASLASVGMYYVPRPYPVSLCLSSRPALLSVQSSVHRTDPLKACSTGSFLKTLWFLDHSTFGCVRIWNTSKCRTTLLFYNSKGNYSMGVSCLTDSV